MNNTFKLAAVSSAALMLATAPASAAGPKLAIGGYYDQRISVTDNETRVNVKDGVDVRIDSEVYFMGSVTLDNGMKIKTMAQLEQDGNRNSGDLIDETYMLVTGSFGAIKLGAADHAPKSMSTSIQGMWAANVGENATFNVGDLIPNGTGITARGVAGQIGIVNDAEMISYTTPKMGGLQAAVGYSQNATQDDPRRVLDNAGIEDIASVAAKYSGKAGSTSFNVGAGYVTGSNAAVGLSDSEEWVFGGNVKMGSIQVSASFSRREKTDINGVENSAEFDTYEVGLRAFMGGTQYSIAYMESEANSDVAAQNGDKLETLVLGMRTGLAKGVKWHNTIYKHEATNGGPTVANSGNDGMAFTTGIAIKF
jgi:outer membrane protein OmpU